MAFSFRPARLFGAGSKLLIVAATLSLAGPARAETAASDADAARNKAIVREAFEAWGAGDNVFSELLAPDVVWTIQGSGPVAGSYHGLEDFVERASAPLISRLATPLRPDVREIWAEGETVIVRFDGSATTTSGAPYRNRFVWILRMQAGMVVEAEAFLDLAAYQEVIENNTPRVP